MEDSLTIEIYGLKATALGALPVTGLLMLMAIICLGAVIVSRAQIRSWAKRIGKPADE